MILAFPKIDGDMGTALYSSGALDGGSRFQMSIIRNVKDRQHRTAADLWHSHLSLTYFLIRYIKLLNIYEWIANLVMSLVI